MLIETTPGNKVLVRTVLGDVQVGKCEGKTGIYDLIRYISQHIV